MIRVSDYIINRLVEENISHIFQVTGRGALFLSDAVAKSKELISVSLHHEQSCAFAAYGQAVNNNNLGACLVSTGCASTNTLTGVLCAWQDGIPIIFISGQNILKETTRFTKAKIRTYGQQEADIVSIVNPITKYASMLTKPENIGSMLDDAIYAANNGRKGPVWIDIPLDLQSSLIDPEKINRSIHKFPQNEISKDIIAKCLEYLNKSNRPAILIGHGVKSSGAENALKELVERNNIPLTYSPSACDIYGSKDNNLSIGSVGSMGCSRAGNFTIQNCDLLIVLGNRLNSLTTGPDFCKFAREAKIIVIDIDKEEHSKEGVKIDYFVNSDINLFLSSLNKNIINKNYSPWAQKCIHWKEYFNPVEDTFNSLEKIDLYKLCESLGKVLNKKTTIVTDSGLIEVILPGNLKFSKDIKIVHPSSQGSMGFALPSSIGVKIGNEDNVLAIIGDGSIMMNIQELESIRYNKLPIKIIVINNNIYSIIRRRQRDLFRRRTIGTDDQNGVSCPNFEDVAKCFGFKYHKIEKPELLDVELDDLMKTNGPVICEIMGDINQNYIELGNAKSLEKGIFVRRPLEDQQPFIDREIFLKEMIVKPIDQ